MTQPHTENQFPDYQVLCDSIARMDELQRKGIDAICASARQAVERYEATPAGTLPDGVAYLFEALEDVWGKAHEFGVALTDQAEEIGCAYVSDH